MASTPTIVPTTPTIPGIPVAPLDTDPEAGTRRRVLELIASDGPVSAAGLAAELDLTTAAIRRHLAVLEGTDQIGVHEGGAATPGRRGRPAKRYVVTRGGQDALSHRYSELAAQALRYVAEIGGAPAVQAFAELRFRSLEATHAVALAAAGTDVAARVRALADALSDDGYAASARPVPGTSAIQLCQGHCPVQQVASEFPQLCEAEAHAFSRVLGVHVQRLATLAGGGHVCTTNIPILPPAPQPVPPTEGR